MWRKGPKRKCVVIDRDFQFNYLLTWILMTMALLTGLVLASVTMFYIFQVRVPQYLLVGNGLCAVLITLVSMRFMVGHSHRIAGPAFRLERFIRQMAEGKDTGHIMLRRKDYLKHIAEAVNYLVDRQNERQQGLTVLRAKAENIEEALAAGIPCDEEVRELVEELRAKIAEPEPLPEEVKEWAEPVDAQV